MTNAAGRTSLVEGEFVFTAEDFRHIAQTLHAHAGIALSEGKAALVYSRLAKRLRVLGLRSFRDYCALIEGLVGGELWAAPQFALTGSAGFRFAKIGELKADGQTVINQDGSKYTLDYSGFLLRLGVKVAFTR